MEMTFVGIYADMSPASVSTMGSAVIEPPPFSLLSFAERYASRPAGRFKSRLIVRYATACLDKSS